MLLSGFLITINGLLYLVSGSYRMIPASSMFCNSCSTLSRNASGILYGVCHIGSSLVTRILCVIKFVFPGISERMSSNSASNCNIYARCCSVRFPPITKFVSVAEPCHPAVPCILSLHRPRDRRVWFLSAPSYK